VVCNKAEAVKKFLKRKGLTERQACEVRQREQALARKQAFVRAPVPEQKENNGPVAGAAGTDDLRKLRKLRGKVLEIEALKAKIGTGGIVHVNRPMQEKIAKLPTLQAQIKALLH
jgi:hypothetical protein